MKTKAINKQKKVLIVGNIKDRKYEGQSVILKQIKDYLSKIFQVNVSNEVKKIIKKQDTILCFVTGFFTNIKFKKKQKIICSVFSNLEPIFFKSIKDTIQSYTLLQHFKETHAKYFQRTKRIIFHTVSSFLPIFVKKQFLKKYDVVVVPHKTLAKKLGLKNVVVVPIGIDTTRFRPRRRISKKSKLSVAFFGHPTADKGFIEVVKAFSLLDDRLFEKILFPTILNSKIKKFVSGIDSSIKITYPVYDIVDAYNSVDIVVIPYRHSLSAIAIPLVLLEAMACEKVIITTYLEHIKEIGKDSLVYVKPYSVKEIVKSIKTLADSKNGIKLGKKARKIVLENYNEEIMFNKYIQIIEK